MIYKIVYAAVLTRTSTCIRKLPSLYSTSAVDIICYMRACRLNGEGVPDPVTPALFRHQTQDLRRRLRLSNSILASIARSQKFLLHRGGRCIPSSSDALLCCPTGGCADPELNPENSSRLLEARRSLDPAASPAVCDCQVLRYQQQARSQQVTDSCLPVYLALVDTL